MSGDLSTSNGSNFFHWHYRERHCIQTLEDFGAGQTFYRQGWKLSILSKNCFKLIPVFVRKMSYFLKDNTCLCCLWDL